MRDTVSLQRVKSFVVEKRFGNAPGRRVATDYSFNVFSNGILYFSGPLERLAHELSDRHRGKIRTRKLAGQVK